jgi:hypothetical protein
LTTETIPLFTKAEYDRAMISLQYLASDWTGEIPYRIHESGHATHYGLGSSPPFSPEFVGYIGGLTCKNEYCSRCRRRQSSQPIDNESGRDTRPSSHRVKATRAFRKLRRHAPLEYDVLWMAVMYHLSVKSITTRLNERAILRGYPERYTVQDVAILAVAGIDKVSRWF